MVSTHVVMTEQIPWAALDVPSAAMLSDSPASVHTSATAIDIEGMELSYAQYFRWIYQPVFSAI